MPDRRGEKQKMFAMKSLHGLLFWKFNFPPCPHQAVLQCCSEMIEGALRQRLRRGLERGASEKGEEVDERPGTPTDMRDVDF